MCTNGTPAMLGCCSGFQIIMKMPPNAIGTQCTLHHQWFKTMLNHLKNVLNYVVTAVNFMKANPLNSYLFADLCKNNGSDFETPLLYSHVRWVIQRESTEVFILRKEICRLFHGAKKKLRRSFYYTSVPYMSLFFLLKLKPVSA